MREYVKIHIENSSPIMTLLSMKNMEKRLSENKFMRVHRSFIINLDKITVIERNRVLFNKEYLPISEAYKEKFQEYIDENFLI